VIAFVEQSYVEKLRAMSVPVVDISNGCDGPTSRALSPMTSPIGRSRPGTCWTWVESTRLRRADSAEFFESAGVALRSPVGPKSTISKRVYAPPALPPAVTAPPGVNPHVLAWLAGAAQPSASSVPTTVCVGSADDLPAHGIKVPEEVCVLGVDNDELLTKVSQPPLSSIALQTQKIGSRPRGLLDT